MLVVVLAGPYLRIDYAIEKRPVVALVFDRSESMQLPAGPFPASDEADALARAAFAQQPLGTKEAASKKAEQRTAVERMTRARLAQAVVNARRKEFLEPISRRLEVRAYSFARQPAALAVQSVGLELAAPATSDASATHLGDAIGKVLDDAAGRTVAGILVFSDGQNTGGARPPKPPRPPREPPRRSLPYPPDLRPAPATSSSPMSSRRGWCSSAIQRGSR